MNQRTRSRYRLLVEGLVRRSLLSWGLMVSLWLPSCGGAEEGEQGGSTSGVREGGGFDWAVPPLEAEELVRYSCSGIGEYGVINAEVQPDADGNPETTFVLELREAWLSGSAPLASWSIPCGSLERTTSSLDCRLHYGEEYVVFWIEIEGGPSGSNPPAGSLMAAFQEVGGKVRESLGFETEYASIAEFRLAVGKALAESAVYSVDSCQQEPYLERGE